MEKQHQREEVTLVVPAYQVRDSIGYRAIKRTADVAIATGAILAFSPFMLAAAMLVWAEDRGPIIYRQSRVGRFGSQFSFYKLRSMRVDADMIKRDLLEKSDAEGAAFKMKNDPRVTKVGRVIRKFSIDEMPQLFSVLKGHMTIIGPRPHLPEEVATYTPEQKVRLLAKPGLICLREINGRSHLSFEDWVNLDLEYVQSQGLLMDLKIFLKAIPAVITGKGAY